jgi:S-adenosylmethionine:tRNA ribosyltransferase-isomerase
MKTEEFNYFLPQELIAQTPSEPRDSSRLLVYDRKTGSVTHGVFRDIINYINKGDVLVINNTRVLPARLIGKTPNGGTVEVLLLKRLDINTWEVLTKPGKKARTGSRIIFSDELSCAVKAYGEEGIRIVKFDFSGVFEDIINKIGLMPLPHYIKEELKDKERYQTVYSRISGSAAAPTAGLHFTKPLLEKIKEKGAEIAEVLLHVGLGTFRPVSSENIEEHKLHSEYYEVSENTAQIINRAKAENRRVIAVGTTSVRVLESIADEKGFIKSCKGETNIFIYPPYKFRCVQSLITNFHLPKSSLIMLVSAFAGKEEILRLYETAVKEKYRFFSFGDAMLIL